MRQSLRGFIRIIRYPFEVYVEVRCEERKPGVQWRIMDVSELSLSAVSVSSYSRRAI